MANEYEAEQELKKRRRKLEKIDREQRAKRIQFIRGALTLPQGRDFFYWLLGITGLKANPFATNALTMSFNCGSMNVGQQIELALIEADSELFLAMLKEQEDARRADDTNNSDTE